MEASDALDTPDTKKILAKLSADITCGGAEFAAGDVIELVECNDGSYCWRDDVDDVLWVIASENYEVASETPEPQGETNGQDGETIQPVDETPPAEQPASQADDAPATASQPAAPSDAVAKDREASFRAELTRAENAVAAAEAEVNDLKGALKDAKETYDDRVSFLRGLIRGMDRDKDRPLLNAQPSGESGNAENARENCTSTTGISGSPSAPNPDAWRSAPISELGLKPKLTERLIEAGYPTIGKLVDLRAAIAIGHEKWPKGIGAAKITDIENAEIDWLGKHRETWGQPAGASASVVETVVGLVPQTSEQPATDGAGIDNGTPTADAWEAMSDDAKASWIGNRADALRAESDTKPRLTGTCYWDQGFAACEANEAEPPFGPSPALDDWLRGWLSCANGKSSGDGEPATNTASLVSIDDL